jgi:hypothetical protein
LREEAKRGRAPWRRVSSLRRFGRLRRHVVVMVVVMVVMVVMMVVMVVMHRVSHRSGSGGVGGVGRQSGEPDDERRGDEQFL